MRFNSLNVRYGSHFRVLCSFPLAHTVLLELWWGSQTHDSDYWATDQKSVSWPVQGLSRACHPEGGLHCWDSYLRGGQGVTEGIGDRNIWNLGYPHVHREFLECGGDKKRGGFRVQELGVTILHCMYLWGLWEFKAKSGWTCLYDDRFGRTGI